MNFEKNSIIGMVLLAFLLFGYFYFTRQSQLDLEVMQKRTNDSLAAIVPVNSDSGSKASTIDSSTLTSVKVGSFMQSGLAKEELITIENELATIVFSNKGGQIKSVNLKIPVEQ